VKASKRKEAADSSRTFPWEELDEVEEYGELCRVRLEHAVPVREPLVLISQIQRSGGTLLSQLFDGHPQCHAHPHEITIGKPAKWDWPTLDLEAPDGWLAALHEPLVAEWIDSGYVKEKLKRREDLEPDVFPFAFSLKLRQLLFEACIASRRVERERDVLDCYFTSYFNAWLDNHNLYSGPKKVVTGFTPRLSMELERVERFFAAYPDGTLISIVRDPRAWYASATRHRKYYRRDFDEAVGLWRQSTEATLAADERFGPRVIVLTYEELIDDTEATVAAIADRIGITMAPELLLPTFNGQPIRANSTDAVHGHGILPGRVSVFRDLLDSETIARIEESTGDLYERASTTARRRRAEHAGRPVSWAR
jgi:sulfotransferase family protein